MEEQGMTWEVYLHEVIWPEVALKKLVGDKIQIAEEDLHKGFDANYGPRVRVRAIVLNHHAAPRKCGSKPERFPRSKNSPNARPRSWPVAYGPTLARG